MQKKNAAKQKNPAQKIGLFALFAALALGGLWLLNWAIVDDVHSYTRLMMKEMYAKSEQGENIDTLFIGPSHCYRAYDPALASELLGERCFNGGSSLQMPDGSYFMLQEVSKTNTLKTVVLECFYGTFLFADSAEQPNAAYLLTDYAKNSTEKFDFLYNMGGMAAVFDNFLPARHDTVSPNEILTNWRAKLDGSAYDGSYTYVTYPEEAYRGDGFVYVNTQNADGTQYPQLYPYPETGITSFASEYLEKIAAFCEVNNIELILATAPLPSALLQSTPSYQQYVEDMRQWAQQHNTVYWDFGLTTPDAELTMENADFSDTHHLSGQGAEKFTASFCKVMQAYRNGEDTDHYFYDTVSEKLANAPDGTIR